MEFQNWFYKQSLLVKVILLLIPGVNWIAEILIRASTLVKKNTLTNIIGLVLFIIPWGIIISWVDLVMVLLGNKLIITEE
jgi:hypothetical protein